MNDQASQHAMNFNNSDKPVQVNCQSWDPHYRFLNSNKVT